MRLLWTECPHVPLLAVLAARGGYGMMQAIPGIIIDASGRSQPGLYWVKTDLCSCRTECQIHAEKMFKRTPVVMF